jgi:hypothetical protein
LTFL